MGIFQQFPYSNFHEMNLDQIIKIMRQMQDEWEATKTEWASYKEFIDNYFENLDVSAEVLAALRLMLNNGELEPYIAADVAQWLADNITPTTPAVDASLSIAGAAADAKATGDAIKAADDGLLKYQDGILYFDVTDGGYISNSDGSVVPYSNWAYTDFISLDEIGAMLIYINKTGTTSNYNAFYDKNKNFIGALSIPYQKNYNVTIPKDAAFVRFSDQSATMAGNFTVHYQSKAYADLLKYQNAELVLKVFEGGYIDNTDGSYVAYPNWACTDFIAMDNIKKLSAYITTSGSPATSPYNAFYDENKIFITGFTFINNQESIVDVPAGAKFARFSGQTVTLKENTRIKYLIEDSDAGNNKPFKLRVMQNNIGKFRWGYPDVNTWGLTEAQYQTILHNYIDMIMEYQPDIITLQEYEKFMDKAQIHNAKLALFNHFYPYASIDDAANTPEVVFMNTENNGAFETKTFQGTDGNRTETCRFACGSAIAKDVNIRIMSGYLEPGSLSTVSEDETIRADQLTKVMQYADNFDTVIIGIDTNAYSHTELQSLLSIASAHNFKASNCDYLNLKTSYVSHVTTPIATANQYYKNIDTILVKGKNVVMSNIVASDYVVPNEAGTYTTEPIRASLDKLASDHIPMFTDVTFY